MKPEDLGEAGLPETHLGPAELQEQARLGRLVAPVTRALRNPTAALVAACDMLAERVGPDDPFVGLARLIQYEGARISDTLSDLAALALPLKLEPSFINIVKILEAVVELCSAGAELHGVRFSTAFGKDLHEVWADPNAFQSVCSGLIRQALFAMHCCGTLTIAAEPAGDAAAPMVRILFADTGPQVPEDVMPRIFDPYLSIGERQPGMSFALGRRIVENLGGSVTIRNNRQAGLTVELLLKSR